MTTTRKLETTSTIKVGPFTWTREDNGDCECWELVTPKETGLTYFCLKNYGGKPNNSSGFTGWRLVSGGPFTNAGGWTSRENAMHGVIPFLLNYYREQAARLIAKAQRINRAMNAWIAEMERG